MIRDILISILFIVTAIFELSFVHALDYPFGLIPLHFILGVVVMHRASASHGIIWFLASGLILNFFGFDSANILSYLIIAIIGAILMTKVFTNRSVYALEGVGLVLFFIFFTINRILDFNFSHFVSTFILQALFLMIGLYFSFVVARYIEHLATNVFLIKNRT